VTSDESAVRLSTKLIWAAAVVLIAAGIFYGPVLWERKLYREAEALTGVGSRMLEGSVTTARRAIESGKSAADVEAAIGKPSFSSSSQGASKHEIWRYYFADGTLTVNVTDGYVARASVEFGPPKIPTSRRP
jgi:hypothetical protein